MARNILPLIAFTIIAWQILTVACLQTLTNNSSRTHNIIKKEQFRFVHMWLRSLEKYQRNEVDKTQHKKTTRCYSGNNRTVKYMLFQGQVSQIYNSNEKVLNNDSTDRKYMLKKINNVNKNVSQRIYLKEKNVTNKYLSQRHYLNERNIYIRHLSYRKERTIWKTKNAKSDTTIFPMTDSRTGTEYSLSSIQSKARRTLPARNDAYIDSQVDMQVDSHRHKRDISVRLLGYNRQTYNSSLQTTAGISPWIGLIHLNNNKFISNESHADKKCSCEGTKCNCSWLGLTSVPPDLDIFITELLLNFNNIEALPNNVFSRYNLLENLNLYRNSIRVLETGSFNGLTRLTKLDLRLNAVNISHAQTFVPLKSLKLLRLNFNSIDCLPCSREIETALSYLHSLEELDMVNYVNSASTKEFGPGFSNMTSLHHLTLHCYSPCYMNNLWNTTFRYLGHIKSLDISKCRINGRYIQTETFSYLKNLQTLNISLNPDIGMEYLPVILWGMRNSGLQTLIMNSIAKQYSFNFINSSVVQYLPQRLTNIVARGNNILSIDNGAVKTLPKSLKIIDIGENNINVYLNDIPFEEMEGLETLLIHSTDDECLRSEKNYYLPSLVDVSDYQQHKGNFGERQFENKTIKNKKMGIVLPKRLKRVQINVQSMYHQFLRKIDKENNLQELDISCSYLPDFLFDLLTTLPKLRVIDLRKSSVHYLRLPSYQLDNMNILLLGSNDLGKFLSVEQKWFNCFLNLTYLDLSKNGIIFLHNTSFGILDNLKYFRLDDNPFTHLDYNISGMGQLKLLNLSNTALSYLSNDVRSHIDLLCKDRPGQVTVDMTNCPIQCDCLNLGFLKWMVKSAAFDKNFTGYKCKYPDTSSKYILDGYHETILVLERECAKNYPMFLIVLLATSVLLCAVMGAIIYRIRWKIRYLYYAAYLKFTDKHKNDNNHEFTYDVFISYDSEDQAFVTRSLSKELENRGLKLLIHTRDFIAGTYITSNIVMAVTESRKTLVVLTRNLVESTWCNYELQMATMEAVHTGRQVLVFLLKENIPSRELDVELLGHIRSNTYLPYPTLEEEGDVDIMRRFYDKLAHDLRC